MRAGRACVRLPSGGSEVSQFPPSTVVRPELNVTAAVLVLCNRTTCEPGDSPPATAVKDNPAGSTIGPILLPGGKTFRTTETNCGLLSELGAVTWMEP